MVRRAIASVPGQLFGDRGDPDCGESHSLNVIQLDVWCIRRKAQVTSKGITHVVDNSLPGAATIDLGIVSRPAKKKSEGLPSYPVTGIASSGG